jgi:Superinfection immunity protein
VLHLASATVDRQHSSASTVFALTVWASLIVLVWLLPAIVAYRRGVPNAGSIVVLNVFFGWMPVVWVLCLALAYGPAAPRPRHRRRRWRHRSAPPWSPWPPPPPPYPPP